MNPSLKSTKFPSAKRKLIDKYLYRRYSNVRAAAHSDSPTWGTHSALFSTTAGVGAFPYGR